MKKCWLVSLVFLLLGVAAAQTPVKKNLSKKPAAKTEAAKPAEAVAPAAPKLVEQSVIEDYLKRVYGNDDSLTLTVLESGPCEVPGVTRALVSASSVKGQQIVTLYVMPGGTHVIMGELSAFGPDPYLATRQTLDKNIFGPSKGPADAPISIVEFADLECPGCKVAQTNLQKLAADFPQLRYVYQNFPLSSLHPWAQQAASYLDCIQRQSDELAWKYLETVYIHQEDVPASNEAAAKLAHYAELAGADTSTLNACAASAETAQRVQRSIDLGHQLKVAGTPAVFINGRLININIDYDLVKSTVEFELLQAKAAKQQ